MRIPTASVLATKLEDWLAACRTISRRVVWMGLAVAASIVIIPIAFWGLYGSNSLDSLPTNLSHPEVSTITGKAQASSNLGNSTEVTASETEDQRQEQLSGKSKPAVTDLYILEAGRGRFEHLGDGHWIEYTDTVPPVIFNFTEKSRSHTTVMLVDRSRRISVLLVHKGNFVVYDPNGTPDPAKVIGEFRE